MRDVEIGGFQCISPKQAKFAAVGGHKGVNCGLMAANYNPSIYGNVSSSTPETDLDAIHLEALRSLPKD